MRAFDKWSLNVKYFVQRLYFGTLVTYGIVHF